MKISVILVLSLLPNKWAYSYDNMITVVSCYAKYQRVRLADPGNGVPADLDPKETEEFKCAMVQGQRSALIQLNDHLRLNLEFRVNAHKTLMPTATLQAASETLDADVRRTPSDESKALAKITATFDAGSAEHRESCLISPTTGCAYTDGKVETHCKFEYTKSVTMSPCDVTAKTQARARAKSPSGPAQEQPQFDMDEAPIVIDGRPGITGDDRRPGQAPFVSEPSAQTRQSTPVNLLPENPPAPRPLAPRRFSPSTP